MNPNEAPKEIKFGPKDMKGRPFLEQGIWVLLTLGVDKFYAKISDAEFEKAMSGLYFEAHHLIAANVTGQGMLIAPILGTLDPEYVNGSQLAAVSRLHPQVAERLDQKVKSAFSEIIAAKATDIPATGKLILG